MNGFEANPQLPSMGRSSHPTAPRSEGETREMTNERPQQEYEPPPPVHFADPQPQNSRETGPEDHNSELRTGDERIDPPFTACEFNIYII